MLGSFWDQLCPSPRCTDDQIASGFYQTHFSWLPSYKWTSSACCSSHHSASPCLSPHSCSAWRSARLLRSTFHVNISNILRTKEAKYYKGDSSHPGCLALPCSSIWTPAPLQWSTSSHSHSQGAHRWLGIRYRQGKKRMTSVRPNSNSNWADKITIEIFWSSIITDIIYGCSLEIRCSDPDHLLPLGPGHHQLLPRPVQLLQAGEGDQVGGELLHLHTLAYILSLQFERPQLFIFYII